MDLRAEKIKRCKKSNRGEKEKKEEENNGIRIKSSSLRTKEFPPDKARRFSRDHSFGESKRCVACVAAVVICCCYILLFLYAVSLSLGPFIWIPLTKAERRRICGTCWTPKVFFSQVVVIKWCDLLWFFVSFVPVFSSNKVQNIRSWCFLPKAHNLCIIFKKILQNSIGPVAIETFILFLR